MQGGDAVGEDRRHHVVDQRSECVGGAVGAILGDRRLDPTHHHEAHADEPVFAAQFGEGAELLDHLGRHERVHPGVAVHASRRSARRVGWLAGDRDSAGMFSAGHPGRQCGRDLVADQRLTLVGLTFEADHL